MLENGHIKLHRRMTKWRWYRDGNTMRLFLHLILTANWEDCDFETITVHRGQRVASRRTLAEEIGMSEREVRTAINHLISTNEVTSVSTSKYTVFTVINYDAYQTATSKATSDRPATDQQATSDRPQLKQDKKEKKNAVSKKKISDAVLEVITTNENNGKDTGLGEIGSALVKKYSDFGKS